MQDYTKDGVLHCGKCNEPKERLFELLGKTIHVHKMCECERQEEYERKEKNKQYNCNTKIEDNRKTAFGNSKLVKCTFENDDGKDQQITKAAKNYVEKFKNLNKGLLLFGDVGTGKTYIACCIANALIDKGYKVLVTNFATLVTRINGMQDKFSYIQNLNTYDLLVIDDLASERDTEYMNEIVTNVIDARYNADKPIIITTNLTVEELTGAEEVTKKRVYSRLLEMCYPLELKGEDRRRNLLKNSSEEMKKELGL